MSWLKHYYVDYFENYDLLQSADSLTIFTNYENYGLRECFWSYEFYSVTNDDEFTLIKKESGNEILCGCQECKDFREELFEYYAVFMALKLVKDKFPELNYCLWLNSEKFINEAFKNGFEHYDEDYECAFLKRLGKDLAQLLSNVVLSQYNTSKAEEGAPF